MPTQEGNYYLPVHVPISRTIHLQQLVIPIDTTVPKTESRYRGSGFHRPASLIPQQPKGLKMRYQPFGKASTKSQLSASEDEHGQAEHKSSWSQWPESHASDSEGEKYKITKQSSILHTTQETKPKKRRKRDENEAGHSPQEIAYSTGTPHFQGNQDDSVYRTHVYRTSQEPYRAGHGAVINGKLRRKSREYANESTEDKARRRAEKVRRKERRNEVLDA